MRTCAVASKKIWEKFSGGQEEERSIEKFGGDNTEVTEEIEEGQRLALRSTVEEEKH